MTTNLTTEANSTSELVVTDSLISCEGSQGVEIHGRLVRMSRHDVTFEVHTAAAVLQLSEVLTNFRVLVRDRPIYSGRATVTSLVNAGPMLICQAALEDSWLEVDLFRLVLEPAQLQAGCASLVQTWSKIYRIAPEYKLAVADIQSFLFELRHWCEQIELGSSAVTTGNRAELERVAVQEMAPSVVPCLNALFERFEHAAVRITPELQVAHCVYAKRQLHSLLLASPFLHRIYRKPLGYPGDYEMVNMILRDPVEGGSMFAKSLNHWVLTQAPAVGHRNRITMLTRRIEEETARVWNRGRPLRVFNLGSGPSREVADFIAQSDLADRAEFTLLDMNEETLAYARSTLSESRSKHGRKTGLRFVKRSVAQMLKGPGSEVGREFDLVYCAGLFDYLPDRVCKRLMTVFQEMLAPGGLLIATNVDACNPIQRMMQYVFEWNLIYRDAGQFAALASDGASPDDCEVVAEQSGSNIFLAVRNRRHPT